MIDGLDASSGRRRAALTLHALAPQDRDWLLEQLHEADRAALRSLLAELQDLGIPADTNVIRSALAEAASNDASPVPHAQGHAEVLAREPDAFRGVLLSLLTASQREAVLAHWPFDLEPRPAPVLQPDLAPRLKAALLQSWHDLAATRETQP